MNWRLGVVGSPIAHSRSPELHVAGLAMAGLRGASQRVEMSLDGAHRLRELLVMQFDALSVTSPLKGVALEVCDEASEVARRTQSVNSLLVRDGWIIGESTDGDGFVDALEDRVGPVVENAHAVVLGAGGAASAIVDALVHRGVASVVVLGRNGAKVDALVARYPIVVAASLVYRPVDLVVNTIPATARPVESAVLQGVHRDSVAVDVTYDPLMSPWRELYQDAGCRTMNGVAMLAYQAARQMSWWWGVRLGGASLLEELQ